MHDSKEDEGPEGYRHRAAPLYYVRIRRYTHAGRAPAGPQADGEDERPVGSPQSKTTMCSGMPSGPGMEGCISNACALGDKQA